jgi:hypothetical protein
MLLKIMPKEESESFVVGNDTLVDELLCLTQSFFQEAEKKAKCGKMEKPIFFAKEVGKPWLCPPF